MIADLTVDAPTRERIKVLFVAQTPPPAHGQAQANRVILQGHYDQIALHHARMAFSNDMEDVGRFKPSKLLHLTTLVLRIWQIRWRERPDALVYSVGMMNRIGVLRDMLVLPLIRWLFPRVVLQFHCGDVQQLLRKQFGAAYRLPARIAYQRLDAAIFLSDTLAAVNTLVPCDRRYCLPLGVEMAGAECGQHAERQQGAHSAVPRILFMGTLYPSKGADALIEAAGVLRRRGLDFQLDIAGPPHEPKRLDVLRSLVARQGLESCVHILGAVTGADKINLFAQSDVFCLPTRYEGEAMLTVILEAMAFGLPVVATRWRAIPDIVDSGVTGLLVAPGSVEEIADALEIMLQNTELRRLMGTAGRQRFLARHTLQQYQQGFEAILVDCVRRSAGPRADAAPV